MLALALAPKRLPRSARGLLAAARAQYTVRRAQLPDALPDDAVAATPPAAPPLPANINTSQSSLKLIGPVKARRVVSLQRFDWAINDSLPFEVRLSAGTATVTDAMAYLRAIAPVERKERIIQSREHLIRETAAGTKILNWLSSTGSENRREFLSDHRFCTMVTRFAMIEGREDLLWTWFTRRSYDLIPDVQLSRTAISRWKAIMLNTMVAHWAERENNDAAIVVMLRAMAYRQRKKSVFMSDLYSAATYLIRHLTRGNSPTTLRLYDQLAHNTGAWTKNKWLERALLMAHRPEQPDLSLGLRFISSAKFRKMAALDDRWTRWRLIRLSFCAVKFLLAKESWSEAAKISDIVKESFGPEFALVGPEINEAGKREALIPASEADF